MSPSPEQPDPPPPGQFLHEAVSEFVDSDPGRQTLDEARRLAAGGRTEEAYRLLRSGLRRMGRWRSEAIASLVEFALAGARRRPGLSDEFAELVRLAKGGGAGLLPALEVFELAGHEERKELLFDHVGAAAAGPRERESLHASPALLSERLHAAAERGQWLAQSADLVQVCVARNERRKCLALWETCSLLVFPEREPWGVGQVEGKVPLPEPLVQVLKPLLELKVCRTVAARPGAMLRLPRPSAPAASLRPVLEGWCRPGCRLTEAVALWADAAMLVADLKPSIPQSAIVEGLMRLRDGRPSAVAGASASMLGPVGPSGPTPCRLLPADAFLRRRVESRLRSLAAALLVDLGKAVPAGSPPAGMVAVPAGLLKGRAMGVPAFWIDAEPVTRARFAAFDPSVEVRLGEGDRPMTGVNWFQARAFARSVGGRLPTAAEWLWAVRSGKIDPFPADPVPGLPEPEPTPAEWVADWTLTGAEKVRVNVPGHAPPGSPGAMAAGASASEPGLPPLEKDARLGFRVAM
jgi:hypothetical protein